ncbi:lipid-binding SYLF domain-containing protein [Siccirubricoccus sp. KC 17139]|uniref:Lipid-binding SYLF domain-containing protein n=1 Tax=Siccirubricoccus soli TaxID=2899147 RepID=A0ABT1D3P6_9PROT|nr:lipid-binding SYLF domain-containing protein [Siccirubricoccus soli]MCO6415900.1 lipid-binding SYLF domain-containing protein [Siccirubricoccus soli]MCP2682032.1 lipid-binding SYLF domain-containing protein [Siccirubricoccus soli]
MRRLIILGITLAGLAGCAGSPSGGEEQALVDRATLTVQDILGGGNDHLDAARMLRRARAALVCPRIFRAGFFFGGEGGGCVLVGRDAAGSWSSPAFYSIGSGSFGLQAGIQDAQMLLLIMNDRALNAVLDSQFKFGADASIAVATIGGSVEASTTAAVGADILAFARTRGLFAGLTLEGSLLSSRSEWNRSYYQQDVSARQIVVAMQAYNPGADPLRAALMRFGSGGPAAAAAPAPAPAYGNPAGTPAPGTTLGSGPVQRGALPPLR